MPRDIRDSVYNFDVGNAKFVVLNTELYDSISLKAQSDYLSLLGEEAKSNGKFLVVSMHKSMYSTGSHLKDMDVKAIRNHYTRVFEEIGVDLVLSGHDHVYTRSKPSANSPQYICAGHAGSLKWYSKKPYKKDKTDILPADYSYVEYSIEEHLPSYMEMKINVNSIELKFYQICDNETKLIDSVTIE